MAWFSHSGKDAGPDVVLGLYNASLPVAPRMPQLGYSPHPPPWHQRRRGRRGLVVGTVGMLALLLLWQGPSLWGEVRERYWRHQCANYVAPPDRVVYEEDPSRAALLLREGGRLLQLRADMPTAYAAKDPDCWTAFRDLRRDAVWPGAVLFLHGRATPSGEPRLICLLLAGWNYRRWEFTAYIYRRNGSSIYVTGVKVPLDPGAHPLRLFAGQPDLHDQSRFTLTYETDGQTGTIDGWIDDSDDVTLQVRDGPAKGG